MKKFLKEILTDPITGEDLTETKSSGKNFLSSESCRYPILENVPIFLCDDINTKKNQHQRLEPISDFDYTTHYKEDAEYFDYFKEVESPETKEEIRRLHQAIIKRIPQNAALVLDAGCGNGWLSKYFEGKKNQVISMDISIKNPVRVLKENPNQNHAAVVADVYHLPFKKNSFDTIIASEIMEHVYDPRLFIVQLMDVLKPGGRLIITTPYNEKIEYFLCVHCNKPTPKNAHLHFFNEQNITGYIPPECSNFKTDAFSNKFLVRLRLNLLMSFLPFGIWKFKDALINSIFNNPLRFLVELNKNK